MEKLLTVVIPAYNAEKYIGYTLDSLCVKCEKAVSTVTKQKSLGEKTAELSTHLDSGCLELKNHSEYLEILIVDDGSTDHTGEIAERYAKLYPEVVRVIHKENGGHGSGINCGIREASGRYLKVVDADDWVEPEAFSHLLKALKESGEDAVVSGFYWRFDNGTGEEISFPQKAEIKEPFPGVQYGVPYMFDAIAERVYLKMHGITWRTQILKEMPFLMDEHCYYVDAEYILYPIPWIKTVRFISDFVYQYRIGRKGQSVSPDKMVQNQKNYAKVIKSLLKFYEKCSDGTVKCSDAKLHYIENGIARVTAGRIKVFLSLPVDEKTRKALVQFDRGMLNKYPNIYYANQNKAVWLLRSSRYRLYRLAAWVLRQRRRPF